MRRNYFLLSLFPLMLSFAGCNAIGDKAGSLSLIYAVALSLSALLLLGYLFAVRKKNPWFLLLFASVLVVNIGYYALATSANLQQALIANRIAYLGSVFLPLAMWMIILDVTRIRLPKWVWGMLLGIAAIIYLIAASPGYLDIYYKEVSFEKINGVTVLNKVYGSLHIVYLFYLLGYFASMVTTIVYATVQDKIDSLTYAAILAVAVFVNIGVWLIEQLVRIDFEILSLSYIISESFLLGLHLFMAETEKQKALLVQNLGSTEPQAPSAPQSPMDPTQMDLFISGLGRLTPKERQLYDCYTAGMTTAQIMEKLSIKENTLKFHNKNLYSKLGVSSRKQLKELHRQLPKE